LSDTERFRHPYLRQLARLSQFLQSHFLSNKGRSAVFDPLSACRTNLSHFLG
jgi:hypothetical protein